MLTFVIKRKQTCRVQAPLSVALTFTDRLNMVRVWAVVISTRMNIMTARPGIDYRTLHAQWDQGTSCSGPPPGLLIKAGHRLCPLEEGWGLEDRWEV